MWRTLRCAIGVGVDEIALEGLDLAVGGAWGSTLRTSGR